jgi:hypothetical protein
MYYNYDHSPFDPVVGISLGACKSAIVTCNTVTGHIPLASSHLWGVYANMSQLSRMYCNSVDETELGFRFDGTCASTTFLGNAMKNHVYGLYLSVNASTGDQFHAGNSWTGAYSSGFAAKNNNAGNQTLIDLSTFFVNPNDGPIIDPYLTLAIDPTCASPHNDPMQCWFVEDITATHFDCSTALICTPLHEPGDGDERSVTGSDIDAAMNQSGGTEYDEETKWVSKLYLMEKIEFYNPLINADPLIAAFYEAMEETNIGQFAAINKSIGSLGILEESTRQSLTYNQDLIEDLLSALEANDVLLSTETNPAVIASIQNQSAALRLQVIGISNTIHTLLETVWQARDEAIDDLVTTNLTITYTEEMEQNERTVNDIFLATIANRQYTFSQQQTSQLASIIHQCPYVGGPAVFKARSMYYLIDPDMQYHDESVCLNYGIYRQDTQKGTMGSSGAYIFPNPASSTAHLIYSLPENEEGELVILSIHGQVMKKVLLNGKSNQISFSLDSFNGGMYLFKIYSGTEVIDFGKFGIVK